MVSPPTHGIVIYNDYLFLSQLHLFDEAHQQFSAGQCRSQNAPENYERLDDLDLYSVDALPADHGIMVRGSGEESGIFRTRPVGVVDTEGHVLHLGTLLQYFPDLVREPLDWVKASQVDMLICSCVLHYEPELVHLLADGNGRVDHLWHTLLISKWNLAFAWLLAESITHDR